MNSETVIIAPYPDFGVCPRCGQAMYGSYDTAGVYPMPHWCEEPAQPSVAYVLKIGHEEDTHAE